MGRTLRSDLSFQIRVILLEHANRSRTASSMEHRAPEEILSVRNPSDDAENQQLRSSSVWIDDGNRFVQ